MTTPVDLEHLERLHAAATTGEWTFSEDTGYVTDGDDNIVVDMAHEASDPDGRAIAALHNALPALIAEVRGTRNHVTNLEQVLATLNSHVAEMLDFLGVDTTVVSGVPCDTWALRDALIAGKAERDALTRRAREAEQNAEAEFAERKRIAEASDRAVIAANEKALEHLEARMRAESERNSGDATRLEALHAEVRALREVARVAQARCDDADPRWAPKLRAALAKVPQTVTEAKGWGEHVAQAVTSLSAADAALDDITGWSGGSGNWPAQETHPRVQAALLLLSGKWGDDQRVDDFLNALTKVAR